MDLIRCPFCHGATFPTHAAKEAHMAHEHFHCRRCHIYFKGEGFRQQHWGTSLKHTEDYCRRHNKIFQGQDWRAQSLRHIETEHYPCGTCPYFSDTEDDLAKHRIREHEISRCPFCHLLFSDPLKWERHLNNLHHWCKTCIKTFDSEEVRRVHYETADAHVLTYCHLCGRHCHDGISLVRHQVDRHDFLDDGWRFSGDKEARQEWQSYNECRNSSSQSGHQKSQKWHRQNKEEPQQRSGYGDQSPTDEWSDPLGDFTETWQKQEQARKERFEQQEQKREKKENDKARAFWDDFNVENIKAEFRSQSESSEDEQGQQQKQKDEILPFPDHYATLNVSRNLPQPEMEKAAKKRRIEVHPDKLAKLTELSPEERVLKEAEAKEVGCSADVLSVAESRQEYDRELLKWERAQE